MQKLSQLFGDAGSDLAELLFLFNDSTMTFLLSASGNSNYPYEFVNVPDWDATKAKWKASLMELLKKEKH